MTNWRDADILPEHGADTWAIWDNGITEYASVEDVRKRLSGWQPQSVRLVARPGAAKFESPGNVAELEADVARSLHRKSMQKIGICGAGGAVALCFALSSENGTFLLGIAVSLLLLSAMFAMDQFLALRDRDGLDERVRFLYWYKTSRATRLAAILWAMIPSVIGATQYVAQRELGSQAALFHAYGFMYDAVRDGELWRVVTGPLLHYSLLHFLNNFFLLILAAIVASTLVGTLSTAMAFFSGNVVGAFGQMIFGANAFDSCGGVSFGIYAVFGLMIAAALLDRRLMPKGFNALCMMIAAIGILSSELASPAAATAGHLTSLVFGGVIAASLSSRSGRHRFSV